MAAQFHSVVAVVVDSTGWSWIPWKTIYWNVIDYLEEWFHHSLALICDTMS
jgi:hypothetical protein